MKAMKMMMLLASVCVILGASTLVIDGVDAEENNIVSAVYDPEVKSVILYFGDGLVSIGDLTGTCDGVAVTGYYDGNSEKRGAMVVGELDDGVHTISVLTQGSAQFYVGTVVLTGIEITTNPTKTAYVVGEPFDATGMVVTATYSDGSEKTLNNDDYDYKPVVLAIDTKYVTISYTDPEGGKTYTDTIDVTVTEKPVKCIYPTSVDGVKYYVNGELITGPTEIGDEFSVKLRVDPSFGFDGEAPLLTANGIEIDQNTRYSVADFEENGRIVLNVQGVYDESKLNYLTVSGTSDDNKFGSYDVVTVSDSWTLSEGSVVTINGKLIVPEGATITLRAGATLTINSEHLMESEIDGTIVIEAKDEENSLGPATLKMVRGYLTIDGKASIAGKFTCTDNAYVTIDGSVVVENLGDFVQNGRGTVSVGSDGQLSVMGSIHGMIDNSGTVVFDSGRPSKAFVHMAASGAVVDVVKLTLNDKIGLEICDLGLKYNKDFTVTETKNHLILGSEFANFDKATNPVATITGLKVVENVTKTVKDGKTTYSNAMDISGNLGVSVTSDDDEIPKNLAATVELGLIGNRFVISESLALGYAATLHNGATLSVSGVLDASAVNKDEKLNPIIENGFQLSEDTNVAGTIAISGEGRILTTEKNLVETAGTINCAKYVTIGENNVKTNNYVVADVAIAAANSDEDVKKITLIGKNVIDATSTLNEGKAIEGKGDSALTIGKKAGSDVIFTLADGANVRGVDKVVVYGTFYAENRSNVKVDVISDVVTYELNDKGTPLRDGWAMWTNLAYALSKAAEGDVIEVSTENLEIANNLTIPAKVTVKVSDKTKNFEIKDGVTLTVNGMLVIEGVDMTAETVFAETAVDQGDEGKNNSSVVKVNGAIRSELGVEYDAKGTDALSKGVPVAGAYYKDFDALSVVSPLSVALEDVAGIDGPVCINGKVSMGDVKFEATEYCDELVVKGDAVFTASSLTLVDSTFITVGEFKGTVTVGDITVSAENVKAFGVRDNEGKMEFDFVSIVPVDGEKDASVSLVAGELVGKKDLAINNRDVRFVVASGAILESEEASFAKLIIEGTVNVASGKSLNVTEGEIRNGGVLSVDAETSTTVKGNAIFATLYVGDVKRTTGAEATVNGPVSFTGQMFVAADAVLDEAALKSVEDVDNTEYFVNGALWMTVYDATGAYTITTVGLETFRIPVENGMIDTNKPWISDEKENFTYIGDVAKVSANVKYDIYTIAVLANQGINDVSIDGNLMQYISALGIYVSNVNLTAGTHTIEYTLANGFSGEAKLAISGAVAEGATCTTSGMSFTISGVPEDSTPDSPLIPNATVTFQLTGIEKSGYVPDSPDAPAESGMGITDYLLIILVVLIVVMAIIVAMRLMRS